MRYYRIVIASASGQLYTPPGIDASLLGGASYTSFVNGQTLPGAWNIELDIPVIAADTPQGFGNLQIWGVSLQEISQANNLVGMNITVSGGMQKGLPLANPAQAGVLVNGYIFQAFGNAIGTGRTLNLVIAPGPATSSNKGGIGTIAQPRNFTLNWQGGQPLGPALKQCLQTAFPGYTINVNISDNIQWPANDSPTGFYPTLQQLAQVVRASSKAKVQTANYAGVSIVVNGTTINVFDGTQSSGNSKTTQIAFQDLIGQPTWIQAPNIQFATVMRADLAVGSPIMLPPTLVTNTQQANSQILNQKANFQGTFTLVSARHIGVFRQPSADSWVSIFEGIPNTVQ